jgi:hypothetical protein
MVVIEGIFHQFFQVVDLADRYDRVGTQTGVDGERLIIIIADDADSALALEPTMWLSNFARN